MLRDADKRLITRAETLQEQFPGTLAIGDALLIVAIQELHQTLQGIDVSLDQIKDRDFTTIILNNSDSEEVENES